MVYLVGDTHIPVDVSKLNIDNFPEQKSLTKEDYVIVLGDFGLLWRKDKTYEYWKSWFDTRPYTTLWLDGNHENFDWIDSLPVSSWNGGKVHVISDSVIHLMRGQVFTFCGSSFFVCGGATSYDKECRVAHSSWWPQEDITCREIAEASYNLDVVDNKVDYILTHTCPSFIELELYGYLSIDPTARFLEEVSKRVTFKKWFFGHHHVDRNFGNKYFGLYRNLIKL